MKSTILCTGAVVLMTGCNSISLKPETMAPDTTVYAVRGGFSMQRAIKDELSRRGYTVVVGKAVGENSVYSDTGVLASETYRVPADARYYVKVTERSEKFRPIWCMFNGVWWWNFNVSVADQQTGTELMTWRGRGCADSSMRLLRKTLDKMEARQ